MTTALDLAAELGHERVLLIADRAVGLRAAVAIHDTTLGPGVGGTRMHSYPSFDAAVADALALARAMTYKAAYAGLPLGGAKAVIDADPARAKTPALLERYARAVRELEGSFVTGGDMGIDQEDIRFMARFSKAFAHAPSGVGPDASDLTALAALALNASLPSGFRVAATDAVTIKPVTNPSINEDGSAKWTMLAERKIVQQIDTAQVIQQTQGLGVWNIQSRIKNLPLASAPEIRLSPSWWPWMPIVPFRISVVTE
jgi:hypothetical protein